MRIKPEVVNGVDEALAINCHLHFGGSLLDPLVQSRDITTRDIMISPSTAVILSKASTPKFYPPTNISTTPSNNVHKASKYFKNIIQYFYTLIIISFSVIFN